MRQYVACLWPKHTYSNSNWRSYHCCLCLPCGNAYWLVFEPKLFLESFTYHLVAWSLTWNMAGLCFTFPFIFMWVSCTVSIGLLTSLRVWYQKHVNTHSHSVVVMVRKFYYIASTTTKKKRNKIKNLSVSNIIDDVNYSLNVCLVFQNFLSIYFLILSYEVSLSP